MKIALLGYGKEGQAVEKYFKNHFKNVEIDIFENFTFEEISKKDYSSYDILFRSPSVPPLHLPNESSVTKYFFDHCPCEIIGVTATKGKGTTCSFIKSLLEAHHEDVYLVGNIGEPAIDILDQLKPSSIVVYEMSSFQLWDLDCSPHIAVVGHLEPDHLNIHKDYQDYLKAKANICLHQSSKDYCVYYKDNLETLQLIRDSKGRKLPYPFHIPDTIRDAVNLPGEHNINNAIAAITAVACHKNISPDEYLRDFQTDIIRGLQNFHGLPHRLEFLRELNHVKYYDDNFATNPSSTKVAIDAFPDNNLVIILGGRDKTNYEDLPEIRDILKAPQVKKVILLGESGHELAKKYPDPRFRLTNTLSAAIFAARQEAEAIAKKEDPAIIIMSPAAASFDMFENVYDRGAQFKNLISSLN